MRSSANIRRLKSEDVALLKQLRLQALQDAPDFFGSSYAEEQGKDLSVFGKQIEEDYTYGAFAEGTLIGMISAYVPSLTKLSHKVHIYGCFIHSDYRRQGLAKKLMTALLNDVFLHHELALVSVMKDNSAGLAVFEACGFTTHGLEPHAIKDGDAFKDLALLHRLRT